MPRSHACHHGHLNCVISIVLATLAFQPPTCQFRPFTAIIKVAAKEKPDVTSCLLNSLALVRNRSIGIHCTIETIIESVDSIYRDSTDT